MEKSRDVRKALFDVPIVQKGKFSAGTAFFVRTLKKVDFLRIHLHRFIEFSTGNASYPTFGSPTMPHLSDVPKRPKRGGGLAEAAASFFFGGILVPRRTKRINLGEKVDENDAKRRPSFTRPRDQSHDATRETRSKAGKKLINSHEKSGILNMSLYEKVNRN